jgi:hypothetical protein
MARMGRDIDAKQAKSFLSTSNGFVEPDGVRMEIDHHSMDIGFFEGRSRVCQQRVKLAQGFIEVAA